MPPSELAAQGSCGGHAVHAKGDSHAIAARARAGFMERFRREVDPDGALPEDERERRATHAMKAHMARLSLRGIKALKAAKATPPRTTAEEMRSLAAELVAGAEVLEHDGRRV